MKNNQRLIYAPPPTDWSFYQRYFLKMRVEVIKKNTIDEIL